MILHVDMDAFYASVEVRDRPELQGRPVVVGGTPEGRGVVAAASYEAREFGVHSAMSAARARRLCPHAVFLPPRMDHYAGVSRQIRDIFHEFTPLVEPLSLDEAFLDVTDSEALFGPSVDIGLKIQQSVFRELQLVASVGVAPNKFLAKVASDLQKPSGFVVVPADGIQDFLDPLPIRRLWGVGQVTAETMARLGARTIGDVRCLSAETLQQHFGQHGRHLWELSRGVDERRVVPDQEAKSVSHETTFAEDVPDVEVLRAWAVELSEQVTRRLRRYNLRGRTVQLKVRFSDFKTITRSVTLPAPTNSTLEINRAVGELLATRLPVPLPPVRLLGVGVSSFDRHEETQLFLFDDNDHNSQSKLDHAADRIRDKFGDRALGRGSALLHQVKDSSQPRPHGL